MSGLDVVAVGHALVDIRVVVDRFPRPDEEAEILREARGAGGSAVNVAIDVSLLGGSSGVIAKIGFDSFGRIVYEELWSARVDVRGLRISPTGPTGFSIVTIDSQGHIALYGCKGVAEALEPGEIDEEVIGEARTVHIASLRLDTSIEAARLAKSHGALVSWDPGRRLASLGLERLSPLLKHVDIVFLNRLEARAMTGLEPAGAARAIASRGPRWVVVKLGAEGALLYGPEGERRIPAFKPPRVVDTTGAGDAFAAAALLKLARGSDIVEALTYASAAAALKVSRLGSHNMPGPREVEELLASQAPG
ncbi:MAG: PfkB family carbohydrate kinase [Desulfurococcales archaeon]|nr:PfkB family carbohydrate kinase [Desulfurococcales archaeon]